MQQRYLPPPFHHIPEELQLSPRAIDRLRWIDARRREKLPVRTICRIFRISTATFYRWWWRFDPQDLSSLEDRSRRPKTYRPRRTPRAVVDRIVALRKRFLAWSKVKIAALLRREGIVVSPSTCLRVFHRYRLFAPRARRQTAKRRRHRRLRVPAGLPMAAPGSLVQIDVKYVYPLPGVRWFQFTALDTFSRLRVLRLSASLSSAAAAQFLDVVRAEFPFPVRNVQTDNGAEFALHFEAALDAAGIPHFFSRPHTPTDLALLERSHRTDEDEFYGLVELPPDLRDARRVLRRWQHTYNRVRPHLALDGLTPQQKLDTYQPPAG